LAAVEVAMPDELSQAAALLGAQGGRARTPAKAEAARRNDQRGGRKSQIEVAARAVVHAWRSEPGGEAFLQALEALEALLDRGRR
jgi:hypothetical protein